MLVKYVHMINSPHLVRGHRVPCTAVTLLKRGEPNQLQVLCYSRAQNRIEFGCSRIRFWRILAASPLEVLHSRFQEMAECSYFSTLFKFSRPAQEELLHSAQ